MGLLDSLKERLEAKKNEELKNLQEKRDNFLKKVPFLDYEQHLKEETERKAQEEAERRAKEEAKQKAERRAKEEAKQKAERRAKEEAERKAKAKEEAERKAKEEAERKAKEEAERKAREETERKAREEAERKAREEAERKAKEEAERKAKEEEILGEFIPKAEGGDAQAACQLGMWFQHGDNGITKDIEKSIYWYQKAAMHGNQVALTFLNMVLEEKKTIEKNEAEEKVKRAQYESEDEYLANEKNDPGATVRCIDYYWSLAEKHLLQHDDNYEEQLSWLKKGLFYSQLALKQGCDLPCYGKPDIIEGRMAAINRLIKVRDDVNRLKREFAEEQKENTRIQKEKREESRVEESRVRVKFSADLYFTDYSGKHDRSDSWIRELTKEEYNALLSGGANSVANYIHSNFLYPTYPTDSVITRATIQKI